MSRIHIHRPSPAMAVAVVALFVAVGGTSYAGVKLAANSVTSRMIKNGQVKRPDLARNAVGTAQVADGSLLAVDFKAGQLPVGATGPAGPQGPKGDAGFTSLAVRAASGTGEVTVNCQPGERATGGGAHSFHGYIDASAPASDPYSIFSPGPVTYQGYTPTSWTADADDGSGNPSDVTAWVICAKP